MGISVYHCIRNKEFYERSDLFADQSILIRRISVRSVDDIDFNVNDLFKTQQKIASMEQVHQELAGLREMIVPRTSNSTISLTQHIYSRETEIENQLSRVNRDQVDFDLVRSELQELEDDTEDQKIPILFK